MKRRKFLKFLGLIPALPIACQGWPFKPKSKPPPIKRYEPSDPVASGSIYQPLLEHDDRQIIYVGKARVWIDPGRIECKSISEAIDIITKMRKS